MTPPPPLQNTMPPARKTSFAHIASALSLLMPVLTIGIAILARIATTSNGSRSPAFLLIGLAAFITISAGIVFAILALCGIREHGPRGLLGKGLAGATINAALLILFFIGAISGIQNAAKSKKVHRELQKTTADLRRDMRESFDSKTGITNFQTEPLEKMQATLRSASSNLTGDEAIEAKAMTLYLQRLQSAAVDYQKVANELIGARVLDFSDATTTEQFKTRRDLVHRLDNANMQFISVITNTENNLGLDLDRLNVSKSGREKILTAFQSSFRPNAALLLQIRDCDTRMVKAMNGTFDLLESYWGKWSVSETSGEILFQDDAALTGYNTLMRDIQTTSQKQIALQKKLVNLR